MPLPLVPFVIIILISFISRPRCTDGVYSIRKTIIYVGQSLAISNRCCRTKQDLVVKSSGAAEAKQFILMSCPRDLTSPLTPSASCWRRTLPSRQTWRVLTSSGSSSLSPPNRSPCAAASGCRRGLSASSPASVSYTHLRAHETPEHLVCRLLLEKKKSQLTQRR